MAYTRLAALTFAACFFGVAAHYHSANVTCENTPEVCVVSLDAGTSSDGLRGTSVYRRLPNGRTLRTIPHVMYPGHTFYNLLIGSYKTERDKHFPDGNLVIPLAFHILRNSADCTHYSCGHVPRANIIAQVNQLNKAFSGAEARPRSPRTTITSTPDTGVRFKLHSISYYDVESWWSLCWDKAGRTMHRMRYVMAVHPEKIANVYTCNAPMSIGFVNGYPWESAESYQLNGAAVHTPTVANNGDSYYNQGDILVHEMGHYLGIPHPYDGGCLGGELSSADGILDTPRMAGNVIARDYGSQGGCPANLDSCPASSTGANGGKDIVDNYMVATSDECRWEFTPGQVDWMHASIAKWKPTLLKNENPGCVTAIDETDTAPNTMPCYFGDWSSGYPNKPKGYIGYGGKRYTFASGPITDVAPPGFSGPWTDSRGWCFIDQGMTKWGYACCAHSRSEDCLAPSVPRSAPATQSPVTPPPTDRPTLAPVESPTNAVTNRPSMKPTPAPSKAPTTVPPTSPTTPPVLPPLECYVDGGPHKKRNPRTAFSKCQFPFVFNGVTYNDCLSIHDNPPKWMHNIEAPKDHNTRETVWCPWKVHSKTRVFQYGKKGNGYKRNWGFCRCNYWQNDPKGHHYDSSASATIVDGRCDLNIGCENCNTRATCERRCDEDSRCKAYVFDEAYDACKFRSCAEESDMHAAPSSSTVAVKGKEVVILHTLSSGRAHDALEALDESETGKGLSEEYYDEDSYDDASANPDDSKGAKSGGANDAEGGGAMTAIAAAGGGAAAVLLIGAMAFGLRRKLQGGSLNQGHESIARDDVEGKVTPGSTLAMPAAPSESKTMQHHGLSNT